MSQAAARFIRRLHRWLGLCVGLPCLLWGVSGAILAFKHYARPTPPGNPEAVRGARASFRIPIEIALRSAGRGEVPIAVEWSWLLGRPRYKLRYDTPPDLVMVDGIDGRVISSVDEALARRVAQADAPPRTTVTSSSLVRDHTFIYRAERELPVYRVSLDNGSDVYVSPRTGEVLLHVDALHRLLRVAFFGLHIWDLSRAPAPHRSFLLLLTMAVLLIFMGLSGLGMALAPLFRPRAPATDKGPPPPRRAP